MGARLLLLVLALALLHALVQARIRPLYQASDEMSYLFAAQAVAIQGASPGIRACIAPPTGELLTGAVPGGKQGFRLVTGQTLRWLCAGGGALPLFALRAVHALSLVAVAVAAWALGSLAGGPRAGVLAALAVAVHPIAAKYAGAVTPDAWANAASAGAFVAGARIVLGRARWWDFPLLAFCTAMGLAWKETTSGLLVHAGLVVAFYVTALAVATQRRSTHLAVVAILVLTVAVSVFGATRYGKVFRSMYEIPDARLELLQPSQAGALATAVLTDATTHLPGFLGSSVLSLYRPWVYRHGRGTPGTGVLTPPMPLVLLGSLWVVALGGLARAAARGGSPRAWALGLIWTVTALAIVAQPSVRQVLLDTDDLFQGRWLFPLLAPWAALVGVGLHHVLGARGRALPLVMLSGALAIWLVVIDMLRHYYVRFPDVLERGALFVRPTGDLDIGDASVIALVSRVTVAHSPVVVLWILLTLLAATSLALVWSAARSPEPLQP